MKRNLMSISIMGVKLWNQLDVDIHNVKTIFLSTLLRICSFLGRITVTSYAESRIVSCGLIGKTKQPGSYCHSVYSLK